METDEIWLPTTCSAIHEVSNKGRVRSISHYQRGMGGRPRKPHCPTCQCDIGETIKTPTLALHSGRILKSNVQKSGHLSVQLGRGKRYRIHILVLEAFVSPRPEGMIGLHRDDNKANNNVENLYWGTYSDNAFDAVRNGTHYPGGLTECRRGHPFDGVNATTGARYCKTCQRDAHRKWKIANPRPKAENPYGRRRLTEEHREMIRGDQRAARIVAADYSISHTAVLRIRRG